MPLTFREFSIANRERTENCFNHGLDGWSPAEWGCAVSGEVGELCNMLKKVLRGDMSLKNENDREQIADEIGDVVAYLDLVASRCGLRLEDCVRDKFNKVNARRDWNKML